jgi:hypothetical protein
MPSAARIGGTEAIVSNPQMEQMEGLTKTVFEKQHPGITVTFDTLNENTERSQIQQDISTGAGLYDVVMLSNYETSFFAKEVGSTTYRSSTSRAIRPMTRATSSSRSPNPCRTTATCTPYLSTVRARCCTTARACWPRRV